MRESLTPRPQCKGAKKCSDQHKQYLMRYLKIRVFVVFVLNVKIHFFWTSAIFSFLEERAGETAGEGLGAILVSVNILNFQQVKLH